MSLRKHMQFMLIDQFPKLSWALTLDLLKRESQTWLVGKWAVHPRQDYLAAQCAWQHLLEGKGLPSWLIQDTWHGMVIWIQLNSCWRWVVQCCSTNSGSRLYHELFKAKFTEVWQWWYVSTHAGVGVLKGASDHHSHCRVPLLSTKKHCRLMDLDR